MILTNTTGSPILVNGGNHSIAASASYAVPAALQVTYSQDRLVRVNVDSGALTLALAAGTQTYTGAAAQLWLDRMYDGKVRA